MKKKYEIFMNQTGNPVGSGVRMNIEAESEFEAIQKAKAKYPHYQVASVKEKK